MIEYDVTITVIMPHDMNRTIRDICTRSIIRSTDQLQHIFGCVWYVTAAKVNENSDLEVTLVLNAYDKP